MNGPTRWLMGAVLGGATTLATMIICDRLAAASDEPAAADPLSGEGAGLIQAKRIYEDRCADCHGLQGRGDGPSATDLDPRPADLSLPALVAKTDEVIYRQITEGKRPMPSYRAKLSEDQRWLLVRYVRTLTAKTRSK